MPDTPLPLQHTRRCITGAEALQAGKFLEKLQRRGKVVGVQYRFDSRTDERCGIMTEHQRHRRTRIADGAIGIEDHDDVTAMLHQRLKAGLVVTCRRLGERPNGVLRGRKLPGERQRGEHHNADGKAQKRLRVARLWRARDRQLEQQCKARQNGGKGYHAGGEPIAVAARTNLPVHDRRHIDPGGCRDQGKTDGRRNTDDIDVRDPLRHLHDGQHVHDELYEQRGGEHHEHIGAVLQHGTTPQYRRYQDQDQFERRVRVQDGKRAKADAAAAAADHPQAVPRHEHSSYADGADIKHQLRPISGSAWRARQT